MLDSLRKSTGTWVIKILFVLLILSFAVWGIGDMVRSGPPPAPAVKVGDVEVAGTDLRRRFDAELNSARRMIGDQLTQEQFIELGGLGEVVRTVVSTATFDMAARDLGLQVSDDAIRREILTNPDFAGDDGRFNRNRFLQLLSMNNLREESYTALLRGDLMRARLFGAVGGAGAAPATLLEPLNRWHGEHRSAEALILTPSALPLDQAPEEEALRDLYESTLESLMAPEYRAASVLYLRTQDVLDRVEVREDAIADYYAFNDDLYTTPETRTVQQVVVDDAETARSLVDLARTEGSLATAAATLGLPEPLDMGALARNSLPPAFDQAIFDLDAGAIAEPLDSDLGWHVLAVTEITPAQVQPLAEVREEIRAQVASQLAIDTLYEEVSTVEDSLGGGDSLEDAARLVGLSLVRVDALDVDGQTPDGTPAAIDTPQAVAALAFSLFQIGDESRAEEMEDGYFIVRLDGITPSAPRSFEEVRPQLVSLWEQQQRLALAEQEAERLRTLAAVPGSDLEALAAESAALTYRRIAAVNRTGRPRDADAVGSLPPSSAQRLFSLTPGGVEWSLTSQNEVILLRLEEIFPAQALTADGGSALQVNTRNRLAQDVAVQAGRAFGNRYGVTINDQVINGLF